MLFAFDLECFQLVIGGCCCRYWSENGYGVKSRARMNCLDKAKMFWTLNMAVHGAGLKSWYQNDFSILISKWNSNLDIKVFIIFASYCFFFTEFQKFIKSCKCLQLETISQIFNIFLKWKKKRNFANQQFQQLQEFLNFSQRFFIKLNHNYPNLQSFIHYYSPKKTKEKQQQGIRKYTFNLFSFSFKFEKIIE